jgi:hypothetical protein
MTYHVYGTDITVNTPFYVVVAYRYIAILYTYVQHNTILF